MEKKKNRYSENGAVRSLSQKHDIKFFGNTIEVIRGDRANNDLGNSSWGKIDFLNGSCGYKTYLVSRFTN